MAALSWRRWRDRLSLRAQLVLLVTALAVLIGALLVAIVQVSLAGAARDATHSALDERTTATISSIDTGTAGSTPAVPEADLDPGVVVYDRHGRGIAGSVPPAMRSTFAELSTTSQRRIVESDGERYAVMGTPFTTASGARGVVVLSEATTPYERGEDVALVVSVAAAALLLLMAAGSAWWISGRVLRPVEEMAETASEWSEHDLERRFALGAPTNEITALGRTLDGLLDKVAAAIRAEQRLTSELAHELRTPLTTIRGTADLLAMRSDLDDEARQDVDSIRTTSEAMTTTIAVLLEVTRSGAGRTRADRTRLEDLAAAVETMPLPAGDVTVDLPPSVVVRAPREIVTRALAPLLDNALRVSPDVTLTARVHERSVDLVVSDHGPGIPDAWADTLFEPGWSGDGGSGLGLALARRVAMSGGGDVRLLEGHNAHGGASFVVRFPGGPAR
ncbi:sensor histidine kinase [Janibacter sp. G349]|uniref:sensor histidine kinase n=1 Tax=Janibacter sp. G349 TaxID=3405424 RepID=UPI003B78256E